MRREEKRRTASQTAAVGSEVIIGVRGHHWGQRSSLGSEVIIGVRGHHWGQRSSLGTEVIIGDRGHHWGQRSSLGTEVIIGDRGHQPDLFMFLALLHRKSLTATQRVSFSS
jgi:hypothetical protein